MVMLQKNEEQALKHFKTAVTQQFGSEILNIRLFGSKARGDSNAKSEL